MEKPISSFLRSTFMVHLIIGGILGIFMFTIPGRTLTVLGWVPETFQIPDTEITAPGTAFVDPALMRVLGAGLLALAFSSFLGWRASTWGQVSLIVQAELVYCLLGALSFVVRAVRYEPSMPFIGYVMLILLAAFAAAWAWAYRQGARA